MQLGKHTEYERRLISHYLEVIERGRGTTTPRDASVGGGGGDYLGTSPPNDDKIRSYTFVNSKMGSSTGKEKNRVCSGDPKHNAGGGGVGGGGGNSARSSKESVRNLERFCCFDDTSKVAAPSSGYAFLRGRACLVLGELSVLGPAPCGSHVVGGGTSKGNLKTRLFINNNYKHASANTTRPSMSPRPPKMSACPVSVHCRGFSPSCLFVYILFFCCSFALTQTSFLCQH